MSAVPQILEQGHPSEGGHGSGPVSPRRRGLRVLGGAIVGGALAAMLLMGIAPRVAQQHRLTAAATAVGVTLPTVSVATVMYDTSPSSVSLPGELAAVRTAALYARTPGYVRRRLVDIGSRVRAGQLLADIDAPDLDQQVAQARGAVAQTRAARELAQANLARWRALAVDSAVTAQEVDQMQAAFDEALANLNSAEANLQRLVQLQAYERVVAPFAGVITARNVDPGALVGPAGGVSATLPAGSGSAPGSLFTVAQTDTLSVYVTVPEDNAAAVAIGKPALVTLPALPGDTLRGRVARTAGSLDPTARTLLTEVRVANPSGAFLPGMYAQVGLALGPIKAPLRVPATALVIRDGPPQVVTVAPDSTARYQTVTIGRDLGSWVEVTGGACPGRARRDQPAHRPAGRSPRPRGDGRLLVLTERRPMSAILQRVRLTAFLAIVGVAGCAGRSDEPFVSASSTAMKEMMKAMAIRPSGDVDRDFVALMVPHHEGAIAMAQAELRYGKNEQLRRMAQEIVVTQQQEIAAMRMALR